MRKALPRLFVACYAMPVRLCMVVIAMLTAFSSYATNFPVTNLLNTGAGSLRAAITAANADASGPHTITFNAGVTGVINLTTSLPAITRMVTIDGDNRITLSGPGGDNHIGLITLGAGSSGSIIKNMILRNTGLEPVLLTAALSDITLEKLTFQQTGTHYANHGIMANAAVTNLTIKDVTMTGLQDSFIGVLFRAAVNNLTMDAFKISGGGGGKGIGVQFLGVVTGASIKGCLFDMDDPATTDDGDYGVQFAANNSNVTIENCTFHDAEVYSLYFSSGTTTNLTVRNTYFTNLDGSGTVQFLRFDTPTKLNGAIFDNNNFNADFRNNVNDGDYGMVLASENQSNIQVINNKFIEHDGAGIQIGANHADNTDNLTISGNTFTNNGQGAATHGGMRLYVRNATSDADSVRIFQNTFNNNNGFGIAVFGGSNVQSTVAKFAIRNNTIVNSKTANGGIFVQYVNKVVISQNSIYNNVGKGIELGTGGNCAYEGANTPQIISSTETSAGVYSLVVKMPAICGTGNCSLEVFSSGAKTTGVGGQHYVTTRTGLAQGNQTITGVTGTFPEINGAPYGTWTATLKLNNNCGTSEFSNKIRVKIVGPAGVNTGIKLWLRGDDILAANSVPTATGQLISGWDELSGGGGPPAVTIINNPLTKLNGINFNPVADMDGDVIRGIFNGAPSWITNNTLTTVAAFNPFSISANGDRYFVLFSQAGNDANTNAAQIEFYRANNNIVGYRGNTVINPAYPGLTGPKAFDRPGIFTSYTTATNHSSYYNGVSVGAPAAYNKGNFAISQWFVGGGWGPDGNGGNNWYYGAETDFAEVFTYNRNLTAAELQKVHSYMALKYAIPLQQNIVLSSGTLVWDITANAVYNKQIGALVRDDVSILEQRQAKAFHKDEVVTFSAGTEVAPTNRDNDTEITNDLSVLIWGNDSTSTAFTVPFAGVTANTRMTRKWKVQRTNWADQDITVKLDKGQEGHFLLISTDPTFTTGVQELAINDNGTVTFNSSLLTNGIYFTFGREQKSPGGVLTGLDVWTRADEGLDLTGNAVTAWEDYGPSMRLWNKTTHATTIDLSPAAMNYNPALIFKGTNTSYFTYTPQFTPGYTQGEVFSVQSSAVNNSPGFPYQLGGASGTTEIWYRYTDNNMYLHFGTNARRNFSFGTKNMALPAILNVNTAANSWTASLDGKIFSGPAAYPTSFAQTGTNNALGVGYGSWFNGPIAEVILYKRKLNATERAQVNSYMALRYGITLDQTTPTDYIASDGVTKMWSAADNGVYKNNIIGIGRDDKGTLLQKQSRSINVFANGSVVALAAGSELAATNLENTDTITNDKSFLTWADNGGATTYLTPVTGEKVTLRMARVWKVDKTNWADREVTIKFFAGVSNLYLLIGNDPNFATFDQELPVNADSTITINSDLLTDGMYFTFAKELKGPGFVNSNVQFWLRADDGNSTGAAWNDFSGNDNNAVQATAASQPAFAANSINFNPGFKLDGANDYMDFSTNAGISGSNLFTIVSVVKRNSVGTADAILGQQSSATGSMAHFYTAANKYGYTITNVATLSSSGTYAVPKQPMLNATTRATGNVFTLYTNGATDGSGTQPTFTALTANLRLGLRATTSSDQFDGDINEVVVYNRTLTATELQQVNSYLALKYGITLSNGTLDYIATDGTTKMWTVSKNGIYNKNIAGLGRDVKTDLFQKQSRSSNDSTVTIALGASVAADNLSNTSDIDDLSFFTWADNGLGTTFATAVTSVPNATARMARVWKVDRTNWADQDITIKVQPGGERYLLIHATDPTFGTGSVERQINTMNGTVTLNTADLPDGAYFTIATKIVGPGCVNNGIATWLRSDYAASPDSWIDFSGNQTNAEQATVANQPAYNALMNYNPAYTFNGTTHNLVIPNAAIAGKYPFGAAARTIVGVGATNITAGYGMMIAYGVNGAGTAQYLGQGSGTNNASFGGYNTTTYNINGTNNLLPLNNNRIIGGRYNGTVATLDVNGKQDATLTTAWNTNSTSAAWIGMGVTATQFWNGKMGEVIVYNRSLSAAEMLRVNSYLALKYGVTLDQSVATDYVASDGTTTMWKASDNTGFNVRITGIGRDDCQSLYQKQSISADAGILAVAVGDSIAGSNLTNAAEITNDNSYLVFGDNNLATTYSTPVTGIANITTMMPRIWKVDKTNFADANITFKLTGGNDKVYLVVSADNTFDASDATYQLDAQGNVQLSTADLPDGAYFSFGKQLNGPGFVNVGVQLWLRADDVNNTNEIWTDFSGNDNNGNQATAGLQPVLTPGDANYNPGYIFNGTSQNMLLDVTKLPTGNSARTLIGVGTPNNVTGNRYMFGWGTAATSQYNSLMNVNAVVTYSGYGNDLSGAAGSAGIGTAQELTATWAGGTGNAFFYNRNRQLSTAAKTLNTGSGAAFIGMLSGNQQYWSGSLNEIIVYNRAIADFERQRISSYLAIKYGYTMDQTTANDYVATDWNGTTGTKYWTAANFGAYNRNIAGIGRDDNTGLNQKQSRSVNTAQIGNMIAIGLNSIEATNADNTATFPDDLSFLTWADNGGMGVQNTEFPAALDPGSCSKITRLAREWKVQKTGNVSSLQLKAFLTGMVGASTQSSDLKLLIDTDGDFGNGGTTIVDPSAFDAATSTVTFDNVNFNNGDYFTIVVDLTNQAPGGVVTNLWSWYRGDKGINATGTVMNYWYDQSAVTKHLAPAVAGTGSPAYNGLINFNPALTYDGVNDVMNTSSTTFSASGGEDIFAVVLPNAVAGEQDIVGMGAVANTGIATELRYTANKLQYLSNNTAAVAITSPTTSNGVVQLANAYRSNAGAASLLMNGNVLATGTIAQYPAITQVNIGSRRVNAANSFFFNGQIAEVAIYNRQLTTTERNKVESYLAVKYGITLSHEYVDPDNNVTWSAANNTEGYGFNITGIGRDDCNGLHQKQSKSVNAAEALVTIGHGLGISASNATNSNTMENKSSFMIGDNNGARAAFTATGAPAYRERIARTWKIQEGGTLGTVTIQVPANSSADAVKLPLERDGVVYMLVKSGDNNFSTGATEVPMTLNGTNWETTYDFASGDYFTFATNDACVSTTAQLSNYAAITTAATDKCYVNGWILFKDPIDASKYIAAIYDPAGLIDRAKVSAKIDVDAAFADLGKGNTTKAARLMRRLLQIDCPDCYDKVANPNPGFIVRMFIAPDEKAGAESAETNNMNDIKTANSLTDASVFKWFKASGKTADEVVSGLTADWGISAGGQEWADGVLPTGQADGVDYVDFTGINGFSTFGGIWLVNLNQALPVTWQKVQATPVDNRTIMVSWSTSAEKNNTGFDVERSEDATNFVSIGKVNSTGNSNTTVNYSFNDNNVMPGVKYYYRIRQTDIDGRASFSKIVNASLDAQGGFYMRIANNPVRSQLQVEVAMDRQQKLQVFISDISGKVLSVRSVTAQQGKSTITTDMSAQADGVYFVRVVTASGKTRVEKFTLQKGK